MAEQEQLKQKLKLQRVELQKAAGTIQVRSGMEHQSRTASRSGKWPCSRPYRCRCTVSDVGNATYRRLPTGFDTWMGHFARAPHRPGVKRRSCYFADLFVRVLQVSEDRARGEVSEVQSSTQQSRAAIEGSARAQSEADKSSFQVGGRPARTG